MRYYFQDYRCLNVENRSALPAMVYKRYRISGAQDYFCRLEEGFAKLQQGGAARAEEVPGSPAWRLKIGSVSQTSAQVHAGKA
jgi:hypothetical protein